MNNTIVYISHGGGPLPLLSDPGHQPLVVSLQRLAKRIPRPSAILMVSAHWETPYPSITAAKHPGLIYDYHGFPEAAYQIQYPCHGSPELAHRVYEVISTSGLPAELNEHRGFDHGCFIPLAIMYPDADIPCVQLSLLASLDSEKHLKLGNALQRLDWDNLLVIGSGASFHNIEAFLSRDQQLHKKNRQFTQWLQETLCSDFLDNKERWQRLAKWKAAPHAHYCHPREEHLLPLHVCFGLANAACNETIHVSVAGCESVMFLWQQTKDHP